MYKLLIPIIFAASVQAAGPVSLPSNFKKCSRSSPDLNDCLKSAIQGGIKELLHGSRPLRLLPLDPLEISTLGINQGTGPVAIKLDFQNIFIHGISKITIESVDAQLNGAVKKLTFKLKSDDILGLSGKYTINGKVLVLPIAGSGDSKIQFDGVDASISFTGKTVTKDGKTYLPFNSVQLNMVPRKINFYFGNLFNGDKALGDNMNKFLNENSMEVYGELKASVEQAFATTFIGYTNGLFQQVPMDSIFLP